MEAAGLESQPYTNVDKEIAFTPGRDFFINYLAFQSGLINLHELVNFDELQRQISAESGQSKSPAA